MDPSSKARFNLYKPGESGDVIWKAYVMCEPNTAAVLLTVIWFPLIVPVPQFVQPTSVIPVKPEGTSIVRVPPDPMAVPPSSSSRETYTVVCVPVDTEWI